MATKKSNPTPATEPKARRTAMNKADDSRPHEPSPELLAATKRKLETLCSDPAASEPSLMEEKRARRVEPDELIPLALNHLKSCLRDRAGLPAFKAEEHVHDYLRLRVGHFEDREVFGVLWLDGQGSLIEDVMLAEGGLTETHICLKHVLRSSLEFNAHAAIIYHNHPSGHTEPSDNDLKLTERLGYLLGMMEIELVDHYIIGNDAELGIASVKDYAAQQEQEKHRKQREELGLPDGIDLPEGLMSLLLHLRRGSRR